MNAPNRPAVVTVIAVLWLLAVNILFFTLRIGHSALFNALLRKFHS